MEIFEEENGGINLLNHLIERGEGVTGLRIKIFLELDGGIGGPSRDESGGAAPFVKGFLAAFGDGREDLLNALFLGGDDVDNGIAGADESFEFLGEIGHAGMVEENGRD